MDYRYITAEDKFIDAPEHPHYNTLITGRILAKVMNQWLFPFVKWVPSLIII
jgi:hypothetical protein